MVYSFIDIVEILGGAIAGTLSAIDRELLPQDDPEKAEIMSGALGSGFMVGFMIMSPLFAHMSHTYLPTKLMAIGLSIWAVASIGCAAAPTYGMLLAGRILSGVGEASFAGLAPTLIDDNAPGKRRTVWLAYFFAMIPFGGAAGYIVSGALSDDYSWRYVFWLQASLMIPIIALALIVPKKFNRPKEYGDEIGTNDEKMGLLDTEGEQDDHVLEPHDDMSAELDAAHKGGDGFWAAMWSLYTWPMYMWNVIGNSMYVFVIGAISFWAPKYMIDVFPQFEGHAKIPTLIVGSVSVVAGFLGTTSGGLCVDWLGGSKGRSGAARSMLFCSCTMLFAFPVIFACFRLESIPLFCAFIAVGEVLLFAQTAPSNAAILSTVPPRLRSFAMGNSILISHLLGDFPSPVLVGAWNGKYGKRISMQILSCFLLLASFCWYVTYRIIKASSSGGGHKKEKYVLT